MRALLFLFASVALTVGCKKADPKPDPNPTPVVPGPVPPNVQQKAPGGVDLKLTAEELFNQATKTPDKFVGKVIEVTGVVQEFGVVVNGEREVHLKATSPSAKEDRFPFSVPCAVVDAEPWAVVVPGQRVKITGTFTPGELGAALKGGRITDRGEPAELKTAPKQLLTEAATDREATNKKYEYKWLRVFGVVTEKRANEFGGSTVVLNADGTTIECAVRPDNASAFKVGEKIAVVGSVLSVEPNVVKLVSVFPVTKR